MSMKNLISELAALKIITPIDVENDGDYYKNLCEKYNKIIAIAEVHQANRVIETINMIKEAIQAYYSGDLIVAYSNIEKIVAPLIEEEYICSSVNQNPAFKNLLSFEYDNWDFTNETVDLFRARTSKKNVNWNEKDMGHIPFHMREIASSGRFSIPGLPCFYFGKSAYICWIEMDKPTDSEFYLSLVNLDDSINIFNLAINIYMINKKAQASEEAWKDIKIERKKYLDDNLILWLLNIATSYHVKQDNRNFKSEYIVSQLIMLCLRKHGIDGLAYFSKRVTEFIPNPEFGQLSINIAIMARYENDENNYSKICNHITITNPINLSEFKQIKNVRYRNEDKSDNNKGFRKHAYLSNTFVEYKDTYFAQFENELKSLMNETLQTK